MIRADCIVARDLCGVRPHENSAGRSHGIRKLVVVAHQVLRRGAIRERSRLVAARRDDDAAMARERLFRRARFRQLHRHRASHLHREPPACRNQQRAGLRVVLRLCDQVGGDPLGIALVRDDDDLRGTGVKIDGTVGGDERLRRGDILVAGADDLVDAGDRFRPVRHGRNRLRAAHSEEPRHARCARCRHHHRSRARARDDDLADAGGPRGNRGHQQGRGQRIPASRNVASDAIERRDPLFDRHSGCRRHFPALRTLSPRDLLDVLRGSGDRRAHFRWNANRKLLDLLARHLEIAVEAVEALRVRQDGCISARSNGRRRSSRQSADVRRSLPADGRRSRSTALELVEERIFITRQSC